MCTVLQKFYHAVRDPVGIHVRPAGGFVKTALHYESKVTIYFGDRHADGKHLLSILSLPAKTGDSICICVDGPDEKEAARAISDYLQQG